jgi:hypothetical protein
MKPNNAELYLVDLGYELSKSPVPDKIFSSKMILQSKEIEVEVWDASLYEHSAQYECSRCLAINIDKLSDGSAGKCDSCEEIDYWDLLSIEIDGRFVDVDKAFKVFKKRGLIKKIKQSTEGCHHCLAVGYHEEWCNYNNK